jgi:hypothetical protein
VCDGPNDCRCYTGDEGDGDHEEAVDGGLEHVSGVVSATILRLEVVGALAPDAAFTRLKGASAYAPRNKESWCFESMR